MSLADILIFIIGKSCRFEPEMENFPAQERGKILKRKPARACVPEKIARTER